VKFNENQYKEKLNLEEMFIQARKKKKEKKMNNKV